MAQPRPNGRSLDGLEEDSDQEGGYPAAGFASLDERKRIWWRNAVLNGCFIASWFFFAILLSMYNKWMFSDTHLNFPYPLFVTSLHMVVQFTLSGLVLTVWPKFKPERYPTPQEYGRKAAPTGFATSLDIGLSNLSLKTVSLSFYTMVKSSSLIFVLLFAFLFHLEKFSWRLVGVVILICGGVLLMVATETHFVLRGFLLVLSASALGGLRWGLTQSHNGFDIMHPKLDLRELTILLLLAPGVLAFCMVLSEFYIIQRAGMVPMSIAGIAKEVATISVSAWFFGDELTPLNITGVAITICGIALFTYHKYLKSIQSTVPLDAHGNPILEEEDRTHLSGGHSEYFALDETVHLTAEREMLTGESRTRQVLFSAEEEEEEEERVYPGNSQGIR
ncbi:hypothetical protein D9757_005639 [Collybiopsis confluens]|uniref:Sugar phosphate transporter domain-containing protein n=1 Tax=Collybiopsis confluens TaxID=2823264 RepID=A0A8H5MCM3_9AGAR|nr:hypothetical protein D9757_005639 [Collybiopsis confluens]